MTYRKAIYVLENIDIHTSEEIGLAIHKILSMTTINAVKKDTLLNAIRYLFGKCYEVVEGGAE